MKKGSPLRTLKFIFTSVVLFVLSFSAVVVTVLNVYVPRYVASIEGEEVAYFENPAEFDEVYETLVAEKKADGLEVEVYLKGTPTYELTYVRESKVEEQNQYTNLRAFVETEYTVYDVAVNGTTEMTFSTEKEANDYATKIRGAIRSSIGVAVDKRVTEELVTMTDTDTASNTYNSLVSRYKPIVRTYSYVYSGYSTTIASGELYELMAGGHNPTGSGQAYKTSPYGMRYHPITGSYSFHQGVDLASLYAANIDIYAYKEGTVSETGYNYSYGYYVKIYHGSTSDGTAFYTMYAHLYPNSFRVSAGDNVDQNTVIANMGRTGSATGVHLHFEMRTIKDGGCTYNNPSYYIDC